MVETVAEWFDKVYMRSSSFGHLELQRDFRSKWMRFDQEVDPAWPSYRHRPKWTEWILVNFAWANRAMREIWMTAYHYIVLDDRGQYVPNHSSRAFRSSGKLPQVEKDESLLAMFSLMLLDAA